MRVEYLDRTPCDTLSKAKGTRQQRATNILRTLDRTIKLFSPKPDSHFCDVLTVLLCQHRDVVDAVLFQALEHGEGTAAGPGAADPSSCCQAEHQGQSQGHLAHGPASHGECDLPSVLFTGELDDGISWLVR